MTSAPSLLALERNLGLMAGAGAGKTYNLVTLCLHLLGGSRADGVPLRTGQLCLLTFTDKAATELKDRLRTRLDELARGELPDPALGLPDQPPEFWRRVRDDLGAALIGTFHSLCVQLLRRAPAGFGVDPAFTLLDERTGAQLIEDSAERLVLDALEAEDPKVVELCRELNFTAQGRGRGLVTYLCEVYGKLREEGLEAEGLKVSDEATARADFEEHLHKSKRLLAKALDADRQAKRSYAETLGHVRSGLEPLTFETFQERWPRVEAVLEQEPGLMRLKDERKELAIQLLGQAKEGRFGLRDKYAGCLIAPFERAFVGLLGALKKRHREALARRGAVDFSELVVLTRDLLRDHPAVRREVQERIRALLVDEFQDTNRLQLELVTLLSEKREGAPRLETDDLPLEPGFLCAVGDRKQSIYEFRGADVSVFEKLAKRIEAEGGTRGYLQQNWRSSPPMLSFFNELFALVMRPSATPRDYEVAYAPEGDDLRPVRPSLRPAPCVDRLIYAPAETAELCRAQDADGVARWIRAVLSPDAEPCVVEHGELRRARGGDVAILFRRFSFLEVYRQALTRMGVPHRVIRGRGFYGAQEVLDLAALLSLVADPTDNVAFAAVLRSPLVGISDASLFRLALAGGDRLSLAAAQKPGALEDFDFPQDEAERISRLLRLYPRLRKERDRLGVRPLLQVALAETDLRVSLAGTPYGEQALANVDKLLELAARWDADGAGECAAFARELMSLADADPTEAQADVLDSSDPRAVQLLTIHQSKGLEWPIVIVPDLAAQRANETARVRFDRTLGLSIKPWVPDQGVAQSPRFAQFAQELSFRTQAEHRRLLYVALTRARDQLVLSGQSARSKGTWRGWIDAAIEARPSLRALVRDVEVDSLPGDPAPPLESPSASAGQLARVDRVIAHVRKPVAVQPAGVVLPVTHLQDYFTCPRRYLYAHHVGLSEFPVVFDLDEGEPDDGTGRSPGDRRLRGTLAHRLLEQVDLWALRGKPEALRKQLEELLWVEGLAPKSEDAVEISQWVEGFLASDFAGRLAKAGPPRVHRELPFLLRLGESPAVHLKGQIDLLFEDDDGGATVIDYKASKRHPAGLEAYRFQLDCYSLAARRFVKEGVPVRTGIVFLRDNDCEPQLRAGRTDGPALEQTLYSGAVELLQRSRTHEWPGLERSDCAALRCGYQYRCHVGGV